MAETKVSQGNVDDPKSKSINPATMIGQALPHFFVQLPQKLQNCLETCFKGQMKKDDIGTNTTALASNKATLIDVAINPEEQLQAWKENPIWADQAPDVKVSVPKGSLCHLNMTVDVGLPPDAVYNIATDPDNKRVFKNIKETISRNVLVDEGLRQVVELEQAAIWKFLWWSGTFPIHVLVDQNRQNHTMNFKQVKTGYMERLEGCWRVEPLFVDEQVCYPFKPKTLAEYCSCTGGKGRIGSKLSLEQLIQPSILPPPPISWYLRGISSQTTEMMITDLLTETARIRGTSDTKRSAGQNDDTSELSDGCEINQLRDIKERWAMRRRNARRCSRRIQNVHVSL